MEWIVQVVFEMHLVVNLGLGALSGSDDVPYVVFSSFFLDPLNPTSKL